MGASRKLMGEIDRVLKKVQEGVDVFDSIWNKVYDTENANQKEKFEADLKKEIKKLQRYRDQIKTWIQSTEIKDKKALMDARKSIEREMERFKICEKETKTKAFSKEGLGQQPKTDPKEKAKSETRDWLNNVVGDLESQIDNFEAEVEGLSVKKGKTRPPRLVHLEISITRHKAHIKKLEGILRWLDNDGLSTDHVNDLKEFLEDYVERNQENFDEFSDVDELYSTLPFDPSDLEDLGTLGPSSLVKTALPPTTLLSIAEDQNEETVPQDAFSEVSPRTPSSKSGATVLGASVPFPGVGSGSPALSNSPATANIPVRPLVRPAATAILPAPVIVRGLTDNSATVTSPLVSSSSVKEIDSINLPSQRSSPAIPEVGLDRGISRGISNQAIISSPMSLGSVSVISSNVALGSVPPVIDIANRNIVNVDESTGTSLSQPLGSLSNRILMQQVSKGNERTGSNEPNSVGEGVVAGGRTFPPSVTGVQWRPPLTSYQNQSETGQIRGRPEIAPDQKDNYIQRFEQLSKQQQGHNALGSVPHLAGANHKQFSTQQQSSVLQQFNSQSSLVAPQVGLGLGAQAPSLATSAPAAQQPQTPNNQQTSQRSLISTGLKDTDVGNSKVEEQRQNFSEDLNREPANVSKAINDDDLKTPFTVTSSAPMTDSNQIPRDTDLSPGQPFQPNQPSSSLGVIGRRSVSDLGAIGDNLSGPAGNSGGMHDQMYNLQMLEAAYHKLPQPQDSERVKNYIPRHPAVTPASFPQTQAPIIDNPALWEKLSLDSAGLDTFFFAFYYQQNTYQQYLAAKELKKQSWRFHKKFNTWFQRHQEPKVTTDDFEMGTYVYFDFNFADDQQGWCQRIKTEFTFQYDFLEDDLVS